MRGSSLQRLGAQVFFLNFILKRRRIYIKFFNNIYVLKFNCEFKVIQPSEERQ